jgi:nucleotide-binding universal stress UspA family protein
MSASFTKDVPRIVVGVDGSPGSRAALRWAVRQAMFTGGVVDAVMAWQVPAALQNYSRIGSFPYDEEQEGLHGHAKKTLEAVIGDEVGPAGGERVTTRVVQGHPAEVLLNAAEGADLLVVGHRGDGSFADPLLGSVGQYCAHYANCPVLIVRGAVGQATG